MVCSSCHYWESRDREHDEESPCSKLGTIGVRSLTACSFSRLWTPRDFECRAFEDAESVLSTERQLEKWFPIREEWA